MKKVQALLLTALLLVASGCNKKEKPESTPPPPPAEPQKKPSMCPEYTLTINGKDFEFCEIKYTSLKDIDIDGNKALGKRAKVTCRFETINNGRVYCGRGVRQAQAEFDDKLKPVVKKLRRGQKITIDLAITTIGSLGPEGHAFDIKLGR